MPLFSRRTGGRPRCWERILKFLRIKKPRFGPLFVVVVKVEGPVDAARIRSTAKSALDYLSSKLRQWGKLLRNADDLMEFLESKREHVEIILRIITFVIGIVIQCCIAQPI